MFSILLCSILLCWDRKFYKFLVIRLYVKIPEEFVCLILQDELYGCAYTICS